jgi:hypothetical protein
MNPTFKCLSESLRLRALQKPQEKAFTYLIDDSDDEVSMTYAELQRQARSIAVRLQAEGMVGQRVLLLYLPGLDFIAGPDPPWPDVASPAGDRAGLRRGAGSDELIPARDGRGSVRERAGPCRQALDREHSDRGRRWRSLERARC